MRGVAGIIEPAIDPTQAWKAVHAAHVALQDAERVADADATKADKSREVAAQRRLEVGRMLVEAKKATKHGEWLSSLKGQGIDERNARNWMALAGYMEGKSEPSDDGSDIATRREVARARLDSTVNENALRFAQANENAPDKPAPPSGKALTSERVVLRHQQVVSLARALIHLDNQEDEPTLEAAANVIRLLVPGLQELLDELREEIRS